MKLKDKEEVRDNIDSEGFDYALRDLTSYEHIKDKEFHKLLSEYRDICNKIETYIND